MKAPNRAKAVDKGSYVKANWLGKIDL